MFQSRLKTILLIFATLLTLIIIVPVLAFFSFSESLDEKLEAKKILKTTEFLVPQILFRQGERWSTEQISLILDKNGYRRRSNNQVLLEMDYTIESKNSVGDSAPPVEDSTSTAPSIETAQIRILTKNKKLSQVTIDLSESVIAGIRINSQPEKFVVLGKTSIAQFSENKQLWQTTVPLSQIPAQCLQAVVAIEDNQFLDHAGVNFTSIMRAALKNIMAGRNAQGGSTITQQLIKNYILSPEKTYTRKFKELFYALNIEKKYSKDEILETYLNIIYLGQSGALQIHGYGAASEYYFGKKLENLKLAECALLAAIINNPGRYNPWRNPEPATQRRDLVLQKMIDLKSISEAERAEAQLMPLPKSGRNFPNETAPYFIQSALSELKALKVPAEGNKVLLTLDPEKQKIAQDVVDANLQNLKRKNEGANKKKSIDVDKLEAVVMVVDIFTGQIMVATGGKNYRASQFNRITEAQRQVGSLAKPFIYYSALEQKVISVDSILSNEKQTFTFGKQKWSPDNYNKKSGGDVPLLTAITQSLNIPVAQLIFKLGVSTAYQTLTTFGLERNTPEVPSIALGAFEKSPLEVLEAYTTLARLGNRLKSHFVLTVEDANENDLYINQNIEINVASTTAAAEVISLMKWTPKIGTAQGISQDFPWPNAGKTGTTNDYKDAWYIGFTPNTLALIWLGFDEPQSTHQTGGGLAVPIWKSMMEKILIHQPSNDFAWPASVEKYSLSIDGHEYEVMKRKSN